MVVYFDGSYTYKHPVTGGRMPRPIVSWGVRAECIDGATELHGHRFVEYHQGFNGQHETLAMVEALLYVAARKVDPIDVSFYTDDQTAAYGTLQRGQNHGYQRSTHAYKLDINLAFAAKLYGPTMLETIEPYLSQSRFTKVKGHSTTVNNLRVDDLARFARDSALGMAVTLDSFEQWLDTARFEKWRADGTVERYPLPFSSGGARVN